MMLMKNLKRTLFKSCSPNRSWSRECSSASSLLTSKAYINGRWHKSVSGKTFPVYNPSTGEVLHEAAECDKEDTLIAIESAKEASKFWRQTTAKTRSELLRKLFELQMKRQKQLAELISMEMGKPITEAMGEIVYGASFFEWFSEEARRINGELLQSPHANKILVCLKEPIGPVGVITPWNFPNAMITRKLAALLAAGCTAVIRPAEDCPFSALAIAKLAEEAGLPPGVVNVVTSSRNKASQIGKVFCTSPDIRCITFTGSTAVGKLLLAESAATVKRVCLELGGNAPFIVFDSADVNKAVEGCFASKFRNTGQTCVASNRIYVQSGVYDAFLKVLADKMSKQLKLGNALDVGNNLGPLVNERAVEKVRKHVEDAVYKGGKIVVGGNQREKCFFEPTLISHANDDMLVAQEETFGPLAAVFKFETEEEVLGLANKTRSGLAGYFYSNNFQQIWRVAKKLEVGMVGVNEGIISCAEAPFGGVKESGLGREGSKFGVDEFTEIKYVCFGDMQP